MSLVVEAEISITKSRFEGIWGLEGHLETEHL